jgi:hypothetical protein
MPCGAAVSHSNLMYFWCGSQPTILIFYSIRPKALFPAHMQCLFAGTRDSQEFRCTQSPAYLMGTNPHPHLLTRDSSRCTATLSRGTTHPSSSTKSTADVVTWVP